MSPILGQIEPESMHRLIKGVGNSIKNMIQNIFFSLSPLPAFVFSNPPLPTHPLPEGNLSLHGSWRLLEKLQLAKKGSGPVFAALPFLGFAEPLSSWRLHTNLN